MQYSRGTLHLNIRLKLHVWCIDLSIHLRRLIPRARGFAEQAQSIERKRFKDPTGLLLWAREAGLRATPIAFGEGGKSPSDFAANKVRLNNLSSQISAQVIDQSDKNVDRDDKREELVFEKQADGDVDSLSQTAA